MKIGDFIHQQLMNKKAQQISSGVFKIGVPGAEHFEIPDGFMEVEAWRQPGRETFISDDELTIITRTSGCIVTTPYTSVDAYNLGLHTLNRFYGIRAPLSEILPA